MVSNVLCERLRSLRIVERNGDFDDARIGGLRNLKDAPLERHDHGSSTITHGRGSVLTVDLTNRCNMMCDPCFMDANQVGFVHELSWEDIKTLLDNAISIKPNRQMSVQFSGGEPTHFAVLPGCGALLPAKSATPACRRPPTASSSPRARSSAKQAADAGLRYAYLQFDGIGNAANSHRKVGNLFDVKLRAIENLYSERRRHRPGDHASSTASTTSRWAASCSSRSTIRRSIPFLSFQPVSFTGRDEAVTDERRAAQRYTLSHLAHDVKNQTGLGEPARDWFPISFMSTFSDWATWSTGRRPIGVN